jgi:hypothetical protein
MKEAEMIGTKRSKWYLPIAGSILGILCCVLGCMSIVKGLGVINTTERLPIRSISIELDENKREGLFTQLRKFSEKHHLKFDLSFYKNNKEFFAVMDGKGLEITVSPRPITITEIRINFYEADLANLPSKEMVDELFRDLKSFIGEIPDATIIEEK